MQTALHSLQTVRARRLSLQTECGSVCKLEVQRGAVSKMGGNVHSLQTGVAWFAN